MHQLTDQSNFVQKSILTSNVNVKELARKLIYILIRQEHDRDTATSLTTRTKVNTDAI